MKRKHTGVHNGKYAKLLLACMVMAEQSGEVLFFPQRN